MEARMINEPLSTCDCGCWAAGIMAHRHTGLVTCGHRLTVCIHWAFDWFRLRVIHCDITACCMPAVSGSSTNSAVLHCLNVDSLGAGSSLEKPPRTPKNPQVFCLGCFSLGSYLLCRWSILCLWTFLSADSLYICSYYILPVIVVYSEFRKWVSKIQTGTIKCSLGTESSLESMRQNLGMMFGIWSPSEANDICWLHTIPVLYFIAEIVN